MMEPGRFFAGQRRLHWVFRKIIEGLLEVLDQQRAQIPADAVADQDTLNRHILAVRRQGIRRHLPTAIRCGRTVVFMTPSSTRLVEADL